MPMRKGTNTPCKGAIDAVKPYQSSVEPPGCSTVLHAGTVRCPDAARPWRPSSQPPRLHAQVSLNMAIPKLCPDVLPPFLLMRSIHG